MVAADTADVGSAFHKGMKAAGGGGEGVLVVVSPGNLESIPV